MAEMHKVYTISLLLSLFFTAMPGAATLPDPTRPPDYTANTFYVQPEQKEDLDFNLTAVRIDKDTRSVILNGRLLRVGDRVGSAEILEIHPAHVILNHDNRRMVVRLYSSFSKTTSESGNKMKITN